ncbi:unnamed protein product [Closterium sp. NIES-64]|nr:unnamed protein product [Closterium sp. NIES-64]
MSVGDRRSASPSSNVPLDVALLVNASFAATELAISCRLRAPALPVTDLPKIGQPSAHRKRDPPRSALRVDLRRGGGGVLLGDDGILGVASNPPPLRTRRALVAVRVGGMERVAAELVAGRILWSPRIVRDLGRSPRPTIGARVGSACRGSALSAYLPPPLEDLLVAAQEGTPVRTLQSSAQLLLAVSTCMRSMLEVEGEEPYMM